jgi:hypothetical protein
MLGDREQADYVPEYLLEGFLRADSAGRASFYKSGIENRWLTPNEARERESLNPLPGGDQFPELPKTRRREHDDEEDTRDPRGRPVGRAALIVEEACARVVQKELAAASKAAQKFANDSPGWQAWCREFYDGHASFVGTVLKLRSDAARRYAAKQGAELAAGGMAATKDWESRAVAELAALALGEAA